MKKTVLLLVLIVVGFFGLAACESDHDHEYSNWTTVSVASCTENGLQQRTCSVCGDVNEKTIKAIGHNFVAGVCTTCGEKE